MQNIFLTVGFVAYFARWFGLCILLDILKPDSSNFTMSGIVRLGSGGWYSGMSSENFTLYSDISLGSLVVAVLVNVVPSSPWAGSDSTTSNSAPSKTEISLSTVSVIVTPSGLPLRLPVGSSKIRSSEVRHSRYFWTRVVWVGGWYWVSQFLRTKNCSRKTYSDLRLTKSSQFEVTVPFLICDTAVKWLLKTNGTEVKYGLYLYSIL